MARPYVGPTGSTFFGRNWRYPQAPARVRPFTLPDRPPPGTYDPSIDAQVAAAGRGYGDLESQTAIDNQRAQDDFNLGSGHLHDLLTNNLADLATGHTREQADYQTAIADLGRNYSRLGDTQAERATAASGDATSGALQQALEARMANMAHDRAPIDTADQRAGQDYTTNVDRANQGYSYDVGNLGLGLSRGNEDRANALAIAGRENAQFGTDAAAQRWFQATQMGYDPPQKPARVVRTPRGNRRVVSSGHLS